MVNEFVQGLERIANELGVLVLEREDLTEFVDHTIEDGNRDLGGVHVRTEGILQVGMPHLQTFMHNVMLVWLHFYISF